MPRESLFFLLCPRPTVALCTHPSPSAAAFCDAQENPLPPVTPDLKPKMEGQGRLGTVAARGPRRLLRREAEGLRPLGLGPCLPSSWERRDQAKGCAEISRRCTLQAKLGWSEEGAVFSLNVALNLALVPSDALSIHLLALPPGEWDPLP